MVGDHKPFGVVGNHSVAKILQVKLMLPVMILPVMTLLLISMVTESCSVMSKTAYSSDSKVSDLW